MLFEYLKKITPVSGKNFIKFQLETWPIYLNNFLIHNTDPHTFVNQIKKRPRIAIVKQSIYPDLYCAPPDFSAKKTILSSFLRSGPVGLFMLFNTDFYIVKREPDIECETWKEFCASTDDEPEDSLYRTEKEIWKNGAWGHTTSPFDLALSCDQIDWAKYDIVISYEIAIPTRIVKKFPNVAWCYFIVHDDLPSYQKSLKAPLHGYDFFLSQKFNALKFPTPPFHEIYFPYHLHYYGCFHDLMSVSNQKDVSERKGIYLEKHSAKNLSQTQLSTLEKYGSVKIQNGSLEQVIRELLNSKYFIRLGGPPRWGNSMIESIAAGCLFIGNKNEFRTHALFTPNNNVTSFEQLTKKIDAFENSHNSYKKELRLQQKLLNYYCFIRPLNDLFGKIKIKKNMDFI